jgi:hypothetical protein
MKNPRLDLFPITVSISQTNSHYYMTISDCNLVDLPEQHGIPLYLYDRTTTDAMVDTYRASLRLEGSILRERGYPHRGAAFTGYKI